MEKMLIHKGFMFVYNDPLKEFISKYIYMDVI